MPNLLPLNVQNAAKCDETYLLTVPKCTKILLNANKLHTGEIHKKGFAFL